MDAAALYDDAPVGLCVIGTDLLHIRVNRRYTELTGKPASFFVGKTLHEISPAAVPQTKKLFRQLIATGEPIRDIEYLHDKATTPGVERSWLAHWFPIKDEKGRVIAANIAFEESSERKRAEAERDRLHAVLDGERRRLATILAQMPAGLIIVDARTAKVLLTNDEGARIFRQPLAAEMPRKRGHSWKIFRPDGTRFPEREYPIWRAINRGEVVSGEEVLIERADGTRAALSVNAAPIRDDRGRIVAGASTFFDVTAQRETMQALRESEAKFRRIAENSPFGLGTNDAEGRITFMNPKLTEIVGYRQRDVPLLDEWFRRVYPDAAYRQQVATQWAADIARVERGEIPHSPVREYRLVCRDGSVKYCEITFALAKDATYAVFNDVTERKRAEGAIHALNAHLEERVAERTAQLDVVNRELRHEIAERQRLQNQLLEVSERQQRQLGESLHDLLGQQLTGLSLMATVLEQELQREGHPGAEVVVQLGAMLNDAVKAARDLSRGFYPVVLEQSGLVLALKDLAASTQSVSGVRCRVSHRASFAFSPDAAIHLYRIAQEAITNALKHATPRDILLELTGRRSQSVLRVTNDGRTYRAPRQDAQSGLGLHIMRHRAALIGARLTLERATPRGCVLTCVLPSAPPREPLAD